MIRKIVALLVGCLFTLFVHAQTDTAFWFAAPEITFNNGSIDGSGSYHSDRPIYLRITSLTQAATVTISQPADSWFTPITVTIPANTSTTVNLTSYIDSIECKPANTVLNYGLHITSTASIEVYYEENSVYNPEMFVLKGHNALGTSFFIPSQNIMYNDSTKVPPATSSFDVVATEDNTTITITPSNNIVGHAAGVPFTVILNKGQTFSSTAIGYLPAGHLMGSTVTSDKPIAVTIKDDSIGGGGYYDCQDLAGDQIVPLPMIGTEYISIPGYLNNPNTQPTDWIFVLATQNNTTVTVNGTVVATLNTSQTYQQGMYNIPAYIIASNPVYVLHLTGYSCEVGNAILPQLDCTGSREVGFTRSTSALLYMHILVHTGGESGFTFNGDNTTITASQFSAVPYTNGQWMYARISIPTSLLADSAAALVKNSLMEFHLGIIHGDGNGCRYGYFSDFNKVTTSVYTDKTNNTICAGDSVHLYCNVSDTLNVGYSWTGPNGFTATTQNVAIKGTSTTAGTYKCTISKISCHDIVDSIVITVNPLPGVTASANNTCTNDTLKLNGTSSGYVPTIYQWTGPNNFTSTDSSTYIKQASSVNAGTYQLKGTLNGCSDSSSVTVGIMPLPGVSVSANNPCLNDTLKLNGTSSGYVPTVYQWEGPNNFTSTDSSTYIKQATSVNAGTYQLKGTLNGCSDSSSVTVSLKPLPGSKISATTTSPCSGNVLTMTALPVNSSINYSWDGPNNYSATGQTATVNNIASADDGNYVLTETLNGCTDSDKVSITVSSLPVPVITSSNIVCENDTLILTASPINPLITYQWSGPDNFSSSKQTDSVKNVSSVNAGIYTLTETLNGCSNQTSATITVAPAPNTTITSNNPPCRLTSLQINSTNVSGVTYNWTEPNGTIITSPSILINSIDYADTGVYHLSANNGGCTGTNSIDISLKEIPVISFSTLPTVCSNDSAFSADAKETTGIAGSGSYSGTGVSSSGLIKPSVIGNGTSTITYTYTATDGCQASKQQTITVNPTPDITTINNQFVLLGDYATLQTSVTGNIVAIQWLPIDGLSDATILSPIAKPTETITYTIEVESSEGCSAEDTARVNVLSTISIPNAFSPNGDGINDKWVIEDFLGTAYCTVNIFDRNGQKVYSQSGYNLSWDGYLGGKPCPVGTYYYVIVLHDELRNETFSGWLLLMR